MKTSNYNLSKIFHNAWYMFRVKMAKNFAEALRKAWKNEKMANIRAMIEGRTLIGENVQAATTTYCPGVLTVQSIITACGEDITEIEKRGG